MKQNIIQRNDEVDLKEVFRTILRYKVSIIFIALIFLIGSAIFAYYKPNIYQSNTTIEILNQNNSRLDSTDFILKAFGGNRVNIDNEITSIESRLIIQPALESLNLTTKYFSINRFLKKTELYKDSPFIVNTKIIEDPIYGKTFELIPITDDSFRLVIKPVSIYTLKGLLARFDIKPLSENDKIVYSGVHKYGEEINTPWFTFTIDKIDKLHAKHYSFNFIPKEELYNEYDGGLSVVQTSEFASILNLVFQDDVSLRAKDILNAISQRYLFQGIEAKTKSAEFALTFIDKQLDYISKRLKKSESNLEIFKEKNNAVDLGRKATLAAAKIAEYESKKSELQTEINILTNVQHFINKNANLSGLTIGTINFADKSLGALVANLQIVTNRRNDLLTDFTELHPEVQKLTKNIARMRQSIKIALKSNLSQLYQRKAGLNRMINKYNKSLKNLPSQEKELVRLNRPFDVNQKIYDYLLQKRAETAILRSSKISNARVLDAARDDQIPVKPNRKLIVLIGLIVGLIAGIALAFLREFLIYTIKNAEEVEKYTSLPIYGVIPLNKNKRTKNIYLEAFRSIRTNLQFLPGKKKNQIISITSSVSGEGKTSVVSSLAEILAQGNKKVIMLDLDLRKASLHRVFKLSRDIGMSDYLTSQYTLEEVIKQTGIHDLDIITTGTLPPNPSELILSSKFTDLLETLREMYDYIVIDTPPAGLVTDAVIIMNYADISFVVVRADYTRKEFVKNIDRMAKEQLDNKVGIILNGTKIGPQYGYGYGASYAHGYGNSQYYKDRG